MPSSQFLLPTPHTRNRKSPHLPPLKNSIKKKKKQIYNSSIRKNSFVFVYFPSLLFSSPLPHLKKKKKRENTNTRRRRRRRNSPTLVKTKSSSEEMEGVVEISDYFPQAFRSHPTLLFFAYFLTVYFSAYFLLFRRWGPIPRAFASSCFTSLFHGTPAALLSLIATYPQPLRSFSLPNTPSQNTVIEFSTAYFLLDLLHYLLFFPSDVLFIIHHIATLYVLLTCRYVVCHGAYSILILLILAEVTSPCQNTWSLARTRRDQSTSADRLVRFLSPKFYFFYGLVRGVIAPLYVMDLAGSYWKGEEGGGGVPRWAWTSWVVIMAVGIGVSILWVRDKWTVWRKERELDSLKKD